MQEVLLSVQAQSRVGCVLFTSAEGKACTAVLVNRNVAFQGHGSGTRSHIRHGIRILLSSEGNVIAADLAFAYCHLGFERLVGGKEVVVNFRRLDAQSSVLMLDQLVVHHVSGPLIDAGVGVGGQPRSSDPSAQVGIAADFRCFGGVEYEAVSPYHPFPVEDVVYRSNERPVDGVAHRIVGHAVPAVSEVPVVSDLEEVRALTHIQIQRGEYRPGQLPVLEIPGSILEHHTAHRVIVCRDQEPVALILVHPEDLRVPEVVLGISFRGKKENFLVFDPVLPVRAGGMHDAFLAVSSVARVVVPGIEEVVKAV